MYDWRGTFSVFGEKQLLILFFSVQSAVGSTLAVQQYSEKRNVFSNRPKNSINLWWVTQVSGQWVPKHRTGCRKGPTTIYYSVRCGHRGLRHMPIVARLCYVYVYNPWNSSGMSTGWIGVTVRWTYKVKVRVLEPISVLDSLSADDRSHTPGVSSSSSYLFQVTRKATKAHWTGLRKTAKATITFPDAEHHRLFGRYQNITLLGDRGMCV